MGPPNNNELQLIIELRRNLQDLDLSEEVLNNANLVRWIRARNHILKDAEEMFRSYIKWFDEIKLESIFRHQVPKEVTDVCIQPICGFDYCGNPITVCPLGQMDYAKLMREGYKEHVTVDGIQTLERNSYFIRSLMADRGEKDSLIQISTISDMQGLSWRQFASSDVIHHVLGQAKIVEAFYPETVYKVIVINAPRVFTLFWSIVKPFLSEKTMEKIQIYGSHRQQWEEAILKLAPKESLPKKYGGILPDDVDILPKCNECLPKKLLNEN